MSAHTLTRRLAPAALLAAAPAAGAQSGSGWGLLNLPQGVTPISREVYDLHMLILWICVAIGVVVFGAIFISILRHRKSLGREPARFHESTAIEIVWTVIPFLILVGMAIPATKTLIAMEDTSSPDLTIKITGYQWKWRYDYLGEGVGFFSNLATPEEQIYGDAPKGEHYLQEVDNPVVIPVGRKVRFVLTANDVIHSWWVPALGGKKDAIPGFINEWWTRVDEPGVYRGECAELCGRGHAYMPIVVVAKPEDEYRQWLAARKAEAAEAKAAAGKTWTKDELMARGKEVYGKFCAACHQANGEGLPGAFPALKGGKIATGPVKDHIAIVLKGKPGTAMAAFGPQLSDADIAAVVTYERNAWGNDTGDVVQPADVAAAR